MEDLNVSILLELSRFFTSVSKNKTETNTLSFLYNISDTTKLW